MFCVVISKSDSSISLIDVDCSPYKTCGFYVNIKPFATLKQLQQVTNKFIEVAKKSEVNLQEVSVSTYGGCKLYSLDIDKLEGFINALWRHGDIGSRDRDKLRKSIIAINRVAQDRLFITDSMEVVQKNIIQFLALPDIAELVEGAGTYRNITLLVLALQFKHPDLWKQILRGQRVSFEKMEASMDCLKHFQAMMHGETALSSAFRHSGMGIPALNLQRQVLIEALRAAFDGKFGSPENEFELFCIDLFMDKILKNHFVDRRISNIYKIDCFGFPVPKASKRVTIDKNSVQIGFEKNIVIPSPEEEVVLKKHNLKRFPVSLEDFEAAQAGEPGEIIRDPNLIFLEVDGDLYANMTFQERLYSAIMDEDLSEINYLISNGLVSVNKPLFRGTTPLMLAYQENRIASVEAMLAHSVDVNGHGDTALDPLNV